jgi:hypothetical protein
MIGMRWGLAALAPVFLLLPAATASEGTLDPYPVGYRHWTHIKTAYVGKGSPAFARFGGMHNIYANAQAMEGYRSGSFPAGSVIVFDVLDASSSDQGVEPGQRKFIDVMWRGADSGDDRARWLFGEFEGDSRTRRNVTVEQGVSQCQACHESAPGSDGVFSEFVP